MKKLIVGAVATVTLTFVGCQNRGSENQGQTQGTGGSGTEGTEPRAEDVNPHAMGGLGPTENVPPPDRTVGAGSTSQYQQPKLHE